MALCDLFIKYELSNFFSVFYVFIAVCFSTGFSEEDLGSPMRTAQCRAGCVNKAGVEETQASSPSAWNLREVSLIHQTVLVIAEIAWNARKNVVRDPAGIVPAVVYLVTWEVAGGGLKGNLFTNSTCVTLSLWPDTVCHIKVEVYQPRFRNKLDQSTELILDTHRVATVDVDDNSLRLGPLFAASSLVSSPPVQADEPSASAPSSPISFNNLPQILTRRNHTIQALRVESEPSAHKIERVAPKNDPYQEFVLGALAAVIFFMMAIATSLAWKNCRRSPNSVLILYDDDSKVKKMPEEAPEIVGIQEVQVAESISREPSVSVPVIKFSNETSNWLPHSQRLPTLILGSSSSLLPHSQSLPSPMISPDLVNFPSVRQEVKSIYSCCTNSYSSDQCNFIDSR